MPTGLPPAALESMLTKVSILVLLDDAYRQKTGKTSVVLPVVSILVLLDDAYRLSIIDRMF